MIRMALRLYCCLYTAAISLALLLHLRSSGCCGIAGLGTNSYRVLLNVPGTRNQELWLLHTVLVVGAVVATKRNEKTEGVMTCVALKVTS